METVIKDLPSASGIEIPAELPLPPVEETGGFPWCGAGIVVAVVAVAVIGKKYVCKCKK